MKSFSCTKTSRTESVLRFDASDGLPSSSTFLVGFEHFRKEHGPTLKTGDEGFESNLYLDPERQGFSPPQKLVMQHDIYSLGIVLLEIGLWQSLIEYAPQEGAMGMSSQLPAPQNATAQPVDSCCGTFYCRPRTT